MMDDGMAMGVPLDSIAHIITVALTPVFLLSGVASLLNVFNARLGRVADQADAVRIECAAARGMAARVLYARHVRLLRRLRALDAARAFGALAGASVCGATFLLFLGALQNTVIASALLVSFGAAILLIMAALLAFFAEMVLSWRRGRPMQPEEEDA